MKTMAVGSRRGIAAALLLLGPTTAHAQQLWYVGDTAYTVVPYDGKVAVQFIEGTEPLAAAGFAQSHPFIIDSIPADPLGRGFVVYAIDSTVGFSAALTELAADAAVKRVFPVYWILPDIGEVPITDLISVKFYPDVSVPTALGVLGFYGLILVDSSDYEHNVWSCAVPDTAQAGPLSYAADLNFHEATEWAVPTSFLKPTYNSLPSDQYFQHQYYLHNTGQAGLTDVDIDADSAWMVTLSDSGLIVAVIDDGIIAHPDIPSSRLLQGWDFVGPNYVNPQGDPFPVPANYSSHGMASAGILAGSHNSQGIVGVYGAGYVLPVKIADDLGEPVRDANIIAETFRFASNFGARVITCGMAFPLKYRDTAISNALLYASSCRADGGQGSVIVFSAGNTADQGDPDVDRHYPAGNVNVIAVGAVSKWGERWGYSCFGGELDFMAPSGDDFDFSWEVGDVWTVDRQGTLGYNPVILGPGDTEDYDYTSRFGGTSAAAPQVAGVAALILARRPDFRAECRPLDRVYEVLRGSADDIPPAGFDTLTGWGRVNAFHALLSVSRGDLDNSGEIDIVDVVRVVNIAFRGFSVSTEAWHRALADPYCDGIVSDVLDVVTVVNAAFRGFPAPGPCY